MTETTAGDVHGPVQSGTFSAPVQTVNVSIPVAQELPPELQNVTLKQMVLGVITALQNFEVRYYDDRKADKAEEAEDRADRQARQSEADEHRVAVRVDIKEIGGRLDRLEAYVTHLSRQARIVAVVFSMAIAAALWGIWQLAARLGVW